MGSLASGGVSPGQVVALVGVAGSHTRSSPTAAVEWLARTDDHAVNERYDGAPHGHRAEDPPLSVTHYGIAHRSGSVRGLNNDGGHGEATLAETERRIDSTLKVATASLRELRKARAGAKSGQIRDLRRALAGR